MKCRIRYHVMDRMDRERSGGMMDGLLLIMLLLDVFFEVDLVPVE